MFLQSVMRRYFSKTLVAYLTSHWLHRSLHLHLPLPSLIGKVRNEENNAAATGNHEEGHYFDEQALHSAHILVWVLAWQEVARAHLTSMRESNDEEIDPQNDFHETGQRVEENRHLVDGLCILLIFTVRWYGVGEKWDDNFDNGHEEQDLESQLEFPSNIRSTFHSFRIVFVNHVVVSIVCITINRVLTHMCGEPAVQASKEECVDQAWWGTFSLWLELVWNSHFTSY